MILAIVKRKNPAQYGDKPTNTKRKTPEIEIHKTSKLSGSIFQTSFKIFINAKSLKTFEILWRTFEEFIGCHNCMSSNITWAIFQCWQ